MLFLNVQNTIASKNFLNSIQDSNLLWTLAKLIQIRLPVKIKIRYDEIWADQIISGWILNHGMTITEYISSDLINICWNFLLIQVQIFSLCSDLTGYISISIYIIISMYICLHLNIYGEIWTRIKKKIFASIHVKKNICQNSSKKVHFNELPN